MKTTEMSSTLKAFADLATDDRAEELRKFAGIFSDGNDETVAARVKRIAKALKSRARCQSYPLELKQSLASIAAGFTASKGKQAADFEAIDSLFEGSEPGASADEFVAQINEALAAPQVAVAQRRNTQIQPLDQRLVRVFIDELAKAVLDTDAFSKVVERLKDANCVPTPTLSAVANKFLGNEKRYNGRKSAIDDILRRQKEDARTRARNKALEKLGV